MNTLWMIVGCGVLAILYGIWAARSVMSADAGIKAWLGGKALAEFEAQAKAALPPRDGKAFVRKLTEIDTDLGVYLAEYHSRLPVASGIKTA